MSLSLLPPEPPVLPPRRSSLSTPVASKVVFSFPQASNDVIARYQEYLLDSYIPADLSALLAERRPARSEDIHVLQRAAAHANLWVLLDREYQAVIRSRGVDFCTLAAAVHLILARLPPYDYTESESEDESEDDRDFTPDTEDEDAWVPPQFADIPLGSPLGRVLEKTSKLPYLNKNVRAMGKRLSLKARMMDKRPERLSLPSVSPLATPRSGMSSSMSTPPTSTSTIAPKRYPQALPPPPLPSSGPRSAPPAPARQDIRWRGLERPKPKRPQSLPQSEIKYQVYKPHKDYAPRNGGVASVVGPVRESKKKTAPQTARLLDQIKAQTRPHSQQSPRTPPPLPPRNPQRTSVQFPMRS